MKTVPVAKFGKDHWSLLGYLETCCVDGSHEDGCGEVVHDRMRTNTNRNPPVGRLRHGAGWKDEYSTRLKSFPWGSKDEKEKARHRVAGHDDWDCLEDLEKAGFAKLISYVNGFIQITGAGMAMAAEIRAHKAQGGWFSNFEPGKKHVAKTGHPKSKGAL